MAGYIKEYKRLRDSTSDEALAWSSHSIVYAEFFNKNGARSFEALQWCVTNIGYRPFTSGAVLWGPNQIPYAAWVFDDAGDAILFKMKWL